MDSPVSKSSKKCYLMKPMRKQTGKPNSKGRKKRDLLQSARSPLSTRAFIETLQSSGRYVFTKDEAREALRLSDIALKNALWRLVKSGRIASPHRGFYIVVPPEYKAAGSIPPSWFIRDLMAYLDRPYYVGLLSASALHGAAHQAPQELQVVTDRSLRPIEIGRVRIRFVKKARVSETPTVSIKTPTGEIRVSSPEATALDLVRYIEPAGHLSNVATVLHELAERLDPSVLVRAAEADAEPVNAQRLGYLLDHMGHAALTASLHEWVKGNAARVIALRPDLPMAGSPRDRRWRVAVNEELEMR